MIIEVNLDTGNRHLPIVSGFRLNFCGDKNCGPHFFLLDKDDQVFCEFVMSPQQLIDVERKMLDHHVGIK